jgi:hypothetical protein
MKRLKEKAGSLWKNRKPWHRGNRREKNFKEGR